jgi:leucyl-tRNA synthetase
MQQDIQRGNNQSEEFDFKAVFEVDDYLYFYGEALTDERTEKEVCALVSLLGLDTPKNILDLACGFGRHTNRLATLGHAMTGVDITPGFLDIARLDAYYRKVEVQYLQGDMRSLPFEDEFDCVMLLFTAFGYFNDEENLMVMVNASKALRPGGLVIFDTPNRDAFLKGMQPFSVMEKEGNLMIDRMSFDSLQGRIYNKRIVFRDGVRKDKPYFTRLYNLQEIKKLLTQAGLGLQYLYGGWDASEFSSGSRRMVVIARKPENLTLKNIINIDKTETRMSELPVYTPTKIEPKWQAQWEKDGLYHAEIDPSAQKFYALTMLPYTSGDLHIGHWYAMTPPDARARYKRMLGYNVMFPIGFDAFGLPAENAAIKNGIHPKIWTYANIDHMRKQLKSMGSMWDWNREAISADPEYYRWTQWFFIQLYKHGLAYRKLAAVDWCPNDQTTLAREQVVGEDRRCERCGTPVIKKELEQWFFKITNYADELLDYSTIDWTERVRTLQINWIGRSEGASVIFHTEQGDPIEVFTTRPDTLWGATFMVLAPEHPLVNKLTTQEHSWGIEAYIQQAARQSDRDREAKDKEKTGVFTGSYAINPVNGEKIPIWIADYVLMTYGTGAIMAVPAHDQRDFEFARKYGLEVRVVIEPADIDPVDSATMDAAIPASGVMVNSGSLTGTPEDQAFSVAIAFIEKQGIGKAAVNYKLRDWLISRQRYWGAPIPMVYCDDHGWNPVPEDQLPVLLPDDVEWKPSGVNPLTIHPTWKQTTCPVCNKPATRETDTMDTFMCSSWYHLRYLSAHFDQGPFDPMDYGYWMPVDTYTGGIEHATMHLMYTRFFHKALRDMGITKGPEPMLQLRIQGIVLGEDNDKMSKSKGNVIAPDMLVARYGADTVRAYLMFFARWDMGAPWSSSGIEGTYRWIRRVWTLFTDPVEKGKPDPDVLRQLRRKLHQTLKQVTHDFEVFEFNTIISGLMELLNEMYKAREQGAAGSAEWDETIDIYLRMMAPIIPHIAEELWAYYGKPYSIHQQSWPKTDLEAAAEDLVTLIVQVDGKLRERISVSANISEAEAKQMALESEAIKKLLAGNTPKKVIVVPGRLVNIVR